jgi:hypothetical protein
MILEVVDSLDVTNNNSSELANGHKYEVTLILYTPVWSVLACYDLYLSSVHQCNFNLYLVVDMMYCLQLTGKGRMMWDGSNMFVA